MMLRYDTSNMAGSFRIYFEGFVQLETSTGDFQLATFDYQGVLLEFLVSNSGWSTTNPKENGGV